jgi:hypothetical protein
MRFPRDFSKLRLLRDNDNDPSIHYALRYVYAGTALGLFITVEKGREQDVGASQFFTIGQTEIDRRAREERQRTPGFQTRESSNAFASCKSFVSKPSVNQ